MRVSVFALAAFSAAVVRAEEAAADAAASSSTSSAPLPDFTPTNIKAPFFEQFTDDWETRWKLSRAKKQDDKNKEEVWEFNGQWAVEEPEVFKGMNGDKGLVVKDKAAHHAISARFPKPIDTKGKEDLVVQYEVKLQNGLECGGAYMKLLQNNKALKREEFSNSSPYIIMFGPDKCGSTNKVHFIFRHKNPKTGEYEEKHLKSPPSARNVKLSTLYTLIVKPDQSFQIRIDGESVKNGTLLEDFSPPVNPDKEIDDPEDSKPDDWVDEARIADPDAKKPDDWNEDAPFEIEDKEATKPADWLDDEPSMIPDPESQKPEDWEDEEDGDWIAPLVTNPKCDEASGCGEWTPPMIKNPEYKGPWSAPFIDNPAYKGAWAPRKIANPNFYEDKTPQKFEPMGAIGYEIWTMQNNIMFDNIYIGHSIADAEKLKAESYDIKIVGEKAAEAAAKPVEVPKPGSPKPFMEDPVSYVRDKVELFITLAKEDPIQAAKFVPEVAGGIGALVFSLLAIVVTLFAGSSKAPSKEDIKAAAKKTGKKAVEVKDQAAEAVSTGAENVKSEVNKRTTRSSDAK